jgi:hypothetical protein
LFSTFLPLFDNFYPLSLPFPFQQFLISFQLALVYLNHSLGVDILQGVNALPPILATLAPRAALATFLQPENTPAPNSVTWKDFPLMFTVADTFAFGI